MNPIITHEAAMVRTHELQRQADQARRQRRVRTRQTRRDGAFRGGLLAAIRSAQRSGHVDGGTSCAQQW